jgi:hypothetical protein
MIRFYSIKYLFTKGIESFEGEITQEKYAYRQNTPPQYDGRFETIGVDAFLTLDEAKAAALQKIAKKEKLLEKQTKNLRNLKAEILGDFEPTSDQEKS